MMELLSLEGETAEVPLSATGGPRGGGCLQAGRKAVTQTESPGTASLDCQPPERAEINVCWADRPVSSMSP